MDVSIDNKITFATGWRRFTFMEPTIFLLFFNYGMTDTIFTDMIVYRSCRSLLANKSSCDILHTNSSSDEALAIDQQVQPHASYIILCESVISEMIPAALILFLGPWSDKFGRKPLLIAGYLSAALYYIIVLILNQWENINPWMFLLASVPSSLLCGFANVMLASFCFVSDITTDEKRTWHLACLEGAVTTGLVIGTLCGPFINERFGYDTLFSITSVIAIADLLYIIFYVPETIQSEMNVKWGNPFDLQLVKELFETLTKKRPGLNRWTLWCCILILSFLVIIIDGDGTINYLFANARLGWDTVQYSTYKSLSMVSTIIGTIVGLKIMKKYFGFRDENMALIGCVSAFSTAMIHSFTWKPWHLYLATGVSLFAGIISPTVRSILSLSAPQEDMGKIFSIITFLETLLPLGGSPLYTLIYSNYMPPVYPSPVYILSAAIFFVMIVLVILVEWRGNTNLPAYSLSIQDD